MADASAGRKDAKAGARDGARDEGRDEARDGSRDDLHGASHDDSRDTSRDDERLDRAVRASYQGSQRRDERAEARVLERVSASRVMRLGWWFESQLLDLRPATLAAAGLIVLAAGLVAGARFGSSRTSGAPATPLADGASSARVVADAPTGAVVAGVPVTFVLRAPGASRVSVAGDFNNWDVNATPLTHSGTGDLWVVRVDLPRGVHLYSFVLDGDEWRPDPSAPLAADAAFGGHNSVIVVNGANGL